MKDKEFLNYSSPKAVSLTVEGEDIVCTSGGLKNTDENLSVASWKASWTEKMGLEEN